MRNALKVLLVVAFAIPTMANALVGNTKHNMSSTSLTTGPKTSDVSVDMCKFCHLVHDANTSAGALWARKVPTGTAFTTVTTTIDGTALPAALNTYGVNAGTVRCLSCHDGSVGLNIVTNTVTGDAIAGASGTWSGGTTAVVGGNQVQLRGSTYMANLNGQHPVGIPYAGLTVGTAVSKAIAAEYGTATAAGCLGGSFCVTNGSVPSAGNYVKLYGTVVTALTVECATCHDPHQDNLGGQNAMLLRVPANVANGRCGACHKK
jgi:hypothetical protein